MRYAYELCSGVALEEEELSVRCLQLNSREKPCAMVDICPDSRIILSWAYSLIPNSETSERSARNASTRLLTYDGTDHGTTPEYETSRGSSGLPGEVSRLPG